MGASIGVVVDNPNLEANSSVQSAPLFASTFTNTKVTLINGSLVNTIKNLGVGLGDAKNKA